MIKVASYKLWGARTCPECSQLLDGLTGREGERPLPGTLVVCLYCGTVLVLTGPSLMLSRATSGELEALPPDMRLQIEIRQKVAAVVAPAILAQRPKS